jgi:ComF family protein
MSGALTAALVPRGGASDKWRMGALIDSLGRIGVPMFQVALPPRCAGCSSPVDADHRFCAECWGALRFIGPPWCAGCCAPFAFDRGDDSRCGACLADPPRHAGIRAAVAYGPVARQLALRLKYAGRTGFAGTMARQIARSVPTGIDLLVPVPLHRWRLWSRGFNQAALIADALTIATGLACDRTVLVRHRKTPVLRGLGGGQRARAVRGAFRVTDRATVRGKAIGLVDDVFTSGATADACTRALLAAGAASVTILCWARVMPGADDD